MIEGGRFWSSSLSNFSNFVFLCQIIKMTTSVDSTLLDIPEMTPEKLAMMKLNAADIDRSVFSDAGDDFDSRDADFSSSRMNGMRSMTRSSKHVRSSSRRRYVQLIRDFDLNLQLTSIQHWLLHCSPQGEDVTRHLLSG